ncbi:MAG TPA: HAMP domain-containing sensor histidine kinase, partial [Verrucomicrobiae bacterium]|jgi:two-component system sensor histidine kinase CpxA
VATRRSDELGRLGAAIDHLAARLAGFVTGQKRFLGDTAHELCSPIARMHVALGILEQRADEKQRPYVDDVREEVQHMSSLVNELLSFSKASLGAATIQLQPVPVLAIVDEVIRRETTPASDLKAEVPDDLAAMAEPELLKRALANLVRNALRYAGHAGRITIAARLHEGRVALTVSDAGPGVPEPHLAQLFDPFYRVDTARARETGGVGLGLTIVKSCVEACGGTVSCRNLKPTGFEAEITLAAC